MQVTDKIYVAGHRGMVGSAIVRELHNNGYTNIVMRSSRELDLRNQAQVQHFFEQERPEYVFWPLRGLVVLKPIFLILLILFTKISVYKPTLFMLHTNIT